MNDEITRSWASGGLLMQGADHRSQPLGLQDGLYISAGKQVSADAATASDGSGAILPEEDPHAPVPLIAANVQVQNEHCFVAVACDGTSTIKLEHGPTVYSRNQIGAVLASTLISREVASVMAGNIMDSLTFEKRANASLLTAEKKLRRSLLYLINVFGLRSDKSGGEIKSFVGLHFFFTIQGLIVSDGHYGIFGLGDGYYGINNEILEFADQRVWGEQLLRESGRRRTLMLKHIGTLDGVDTLWIATDGIAPALRPAVRDRFAVFLNDPLTCGRNSEGEDTTLRAFRRHLYRHCHFGDDIALAIMRNRPVMIEKEKGDHWRYGLPVANS